VSVSNGQRPNLGVLTPLELSEMQRIADMISDGVRRVALLQRGQRDFYRELRERHALPPRFDIDPVTGLIYAPTPEPAEPA
jgi:hypothetical protein